MEDLNLTSDTASSGEPYKVGIMPTEDGEKVVLVLRAEQDDQIILWLDSSTAQILGKALILIGQRIEADGTDIPPIQN